MNVNKIFTFSVGWPARIKLNQVVLHKHQCHNFITLHLGQVREFTCCGNFNTVETNFISKLDCHNTLMCNKVNFVHIPPAIYDPLDLGLN